MPWRRDANWKVNFRDGAAAQVLHDGKTTTMRGELITDTAHVAGLYARCAESYGVKRAERSMGWRSATTRCRPTISSPRPSSGWTCGRSGSLPQHEVTMCRCARLRATSWWADCSCRSRGGHIVHPDPAGDSCGRMRPRRGSTGLRDHRLLIAGGVHR